MRRPTCRNDGGGTGFGGFGGAGPSTCVGGSDAMMRVIAAVAAVLTVLAVLLDAYGGPGLASGAWTYAGMLALAAGSSAVATMVGLGGGLIIVPVLLFMGLSPSVAASASLAATLSNAAASTAAYARQGRIDYREGMIMGAMAAPGSVLGAVWSSDAEPGIFGLLLASALAAAAVYIFARSRLRSRGASHGYIVAVLSAAASVFAGMVSSFFGIGGGVVFVPFLVVVLGMGMMRAAPTSMFALILTSTAGVAAHAALGHSDAVLALLLSAGGLVGGLAGARISLVMGERYLQVMATTLLLAAAAKLVWDALSANAQ